MRRLLTLSQEIRLLAVHERMSEREFLEDTWSPGCPECGRDRRFLLVVDYGDGASREKLILVCPVCKVESVILDYRSDEVIRVIWRNRDEGDCSVQSKRRSG